MLFAAISHIACFMYRDSSNVGPHSEPFVIHCRFDRLKAQFQSSSDRV
jgi:hypothetical protein